MNKLTAEQRLKAIHKLIKSDVGLEADIYINREDKDKDKYAQMFSRLINDIYKIVHPHFSTYGHDIWDKETLKNNYWGKTKKLEDII